MKLMARIYLRAPMGGREHLSCYNNEGAVSLSLVGGVDMPLSLSNLQVKERFPAFWDVKEPRNTVEAIRRVLRTSVVEEDGYDLHPDIDVGDGFRHAPLFKRHR